MAKLQAAINLSDAFVSCNSLTGKIWLDLDGLTFPEKNWSDLVVPITGSWCSCLHDILAGGCGEIELPFIDGPFRAIIRRAEPHWHVFFINDYTKETLAKGNFNPISFAHSLLKVASKLSKYCDNLCLIPNQATFFQTSKEKLEAQVEMNLQ